MQPAPRAPAAYITCLPRRNRSHRQLHPHPRDSPLQPTLGTPHPTRPLRPTKSHYSYTKPTSTFTTPTKSSSTSTKPLTTTTMTAESSQQQQQMADPSIDRMDHDLDQDAQEATTSLPNIIPDSQLSPDTYRFPSERLLRRQRQEGKTPLVLVACGSFRSVIPHSSTVTAVRDDASRATLLTNAAIPTAP